MSNEAANFWIGFFLGGIIFACLFGGIVKSIWRTEAIQHNVGYYNSTNAHFEWRTITNK
jgi:hypothetical protein